MNVRVRVCVRLLCIAEYRNVKCARASFCIVFAMTWLKLKLYIELMNGFGRSKVEFCPMCICYRRLQIFIKTAGPPENHCMTIEAKQQTLILDAK